jgi:hypothetical protein
MFHRESRNSAQTILTVCTLVLAIAAASCTSEPSSAPSPTVESADVPCGECGKKVARQNAEPHISPEGLDVYVCKACLSRPRQGKSRSSPPGRTSNKTSSKGTT